MSHVAGQPENIAYLTLFFAGNLIAHVHVNWLAPVKVRRTLIGGSQKMIVYDDLEPSEKVKVYDKGITVNRKETRSSSTRCWSATAPATCWRPQLDMTEALRVEAAHFVRCIEQRRAARSPTARPACASCRSSRPPPSPCATGGAPSISRSPS